MSEHMTFGLRFRLLSLIVIALLPVIGFILLNSLRQRQLAVVNAEGDVSAAVILAAEQYAVTIEETRQFLLAMSYISEINGADVPVCDALLRSLVKERPLYINFLVVESDGTLFSSAAAHTGRVSYADRSWFRLIHETRQFVNGGFQIGRLTLKPLLSLAYPLLDSRGGIRRILVAALDLTWLSGLASRMSLAPGSVVSVFDQDGTVLSRSPNPESWIGKSVP